MLPQIESERLILRPPQLVDEVPINQAINNSFPELQRWMTWAKDSTMAPTVSFAKEPIRPYASRSQGDFR